MLAIRAHSDAPDAVAGVIRGVIPVPTLRVNICVFDETQLWVHIYDFEQFLREKREKHLATGLKRTAAKSRLIEALKGGQAKYIYLLKNIFQEILETFI